MVQMASPRPFVRVLDRFRSARELGPREAFKARVLVGQSLLGIIVAAFSTAQELLYGDRVSGAIIAMFGALLVMQLVLLRFGVPLVVVVWACISALGASSSRTRS